MPEALPFIIAVDGPSASGKGTLSEKLAHHFNFAFLDTGKIYRIVAYEVLKANLDPNDIAGLVALAHTINFAMSSCDSLHTPEISECASKIAIHAELRNVLNQIQRGFPKGHKGAVIDGRDIGTVIFPDANLKFFITASDEVRAERRFKQLQSNNKLVSYADVLRDLKERDARDADRKVSPTKAASDAIVIDTSNLDAKAVLELTISLCRKHVDDYFKKLLQLAS
jgi:cytidylate kinase